MSLLALFPVSLVPLPRSGLVAIAGKPNAGKSTLLNRLVGQKLAITSAKPQSTRERVTGIVLHGDSQIVLVDTPGLFDPRYALQRSMRAAALQALRDADVILYLIDASAGDTSDLAAAAGTAPPPRTPLITVFSKSDLVTVEERARLARSAAEALFVSALTGEGIDALVDRVATMLPESPFLFPEDETSTQSLRFFAAEAIREAALEQLSEEVPYSIACQIEEFREDRNPVYIRAVLFVERASQKQIVIGQKGSRIREIGTSARQKIEALTQSPVYLDLWVKVLANWRRDIDALRRLGFHVTEEQ